MTENPIGKELRIARIMAELNQVQVAEAVGCASNYYSDIERGVHIPSARLLRDLKEAVRWTPQISVLVQTNPSAPTGAPASDPAEEGA